MTSQTLRTIISLLESTETHAFYRREYGYKIRDGESRFWETSETYTVRICVRHKHTDNDTRGTCTFLALCTCLCKMFVWSWCRCWAYSTVNFFCFRENTFCRFSFFCMEKKIGVKQGYLLTRRIKQLLVCIQCIQYIFTCEMWTYT